MAAAALCALVFHSLEPSAVSAAAVRHMSFADFAGHVVKVLLRPGLVAAVPKSAPSGELLRVLATCIGLCHVELDQLVPQALARWLLSAVPLMVDSLSAGSAGSDAPLLRRRAATALLRGATEDYSSAAALHAMAADGVDAGKLLASATQLVDLNADLLRTGVRVAPTAEAASSVRSLALTLTDAWQQPGFPSDDV